jgi:class I fructose-bisphosphate aldolase
MVILPVDQGFEHGPARSFAPNPPCYDARYHFELAIESGCNAYAAPLGQLSAGLGGFEGEIPTILKLNNSDTLAQTEDAHSAVTASVQDALRLGCSAIGFTIYPGSKLRNVMYQELRSLIAEARDAGLPTIVWSYPRGVGISKNGETAIDVVAYGAHIAAQLGAHVIKVKPPTAHLEQEAAKKVYEGKQVPIATLSDRIRNVVRSCFEGRRLVIFSGGEAKDTASVLGEIQEIANGGGMGSIMGRNAFQRPRAESLKLLRDVMAIYKGCDQA